MFINRCAARLNMLCDSALNAYKKYGVVNSKDVGGNSTDKIHQRGLLINYESLPGIVPSVLLPRVFGVPLNKRWIEKMRSECSYYSKGRNEKKIFKGDSQDKDNRSSFTMQKYAKKILSRSFSELEGAMVEGLTRVDVHVPNKTGIFAIGNTVEISRDWQVLKIIPSFEDLVTIPLSQRRFTTEPQTPPLTSSAEMNKPIFTATKSLNSTSSLIIKHSHFEFDTNFLPWIPFSNTHKSVRYEVHYHSIF